MDGCREKQSPKKFAVPCASALRAMHAAVELRQARLRERQDAIRSQLVATELDLAMTFCQVAANTKSQDRYERNIANAPGSLFRRSLFPQLQPSEEHSTP